MKNTLESAMKFRYSNNYEFIGLDEDGNEILYIHCEREYNEVYKTALEFAERFINIGCDSLVVKDLFFNDVALHIYKSSLIHFGEYNKYVIACQIIATVVGCEGGYND